MLLRHSVLYLIARGVPGILNFLVIGLLTRLLTPEQYGQYALVVALALLVKMLLFQWLLASLLRFLPGSNDEPKLLSTLLTGYVLTVLLVAGLGTAGIWFLRGTEWRSLLVLGILLVVAQSAFDLGLDLVRSKLSPLRYGLLAVGRAGLALGVGCLLAYLGYGATGAILGQILGMSLPVVVGLINELRTVRLNLVDWGLLRKCITYGLPLTITFSLSYVVNTSDRLVLGWLRGPAEAGLYAVGYDLAQQSLRVLMASVSLAAYPLAVRALELNGESSARAQLVHNGTLLMAISLPATVGMAMLYQNIGLVVFGGSFQTSASLIPLIAAATLLAGLKEYHLDQSFQLGRKTVGQVWIALASALINIGLNYLWIPKMGALGAAYSTVAAYMFALVLTWVKGRQVFAIPLFLPDVLKCVMATLAMALALWPISSWMGTVALFTQLCLGGFVYGGMIFVLDVEKSRSRLFSYANRLFHGG